MARAASRGFQCERFAGRNQREPSHETVSLAVCLRSHLHWFFPSSSDVLSRKAHKGRKALPRTNLILSWLALKCSRLYILREAVPYYKTRVSFLFQLVESQDPEFRRSVDAVMERIPKTRLWCGLLLLFHRNAGR